MHIIIGYNKNFEDYLKKYQIPFKRSSELVMDGNGLFDKVVLNNDIDTIETIKSDIYACWELSKIFRTTVFTLGSVEMVLYVLSETIWSNNIFCILKCISSRTDDNVELFEMFCVKINFPNGFILFDVCDSDIIDLKNYQIFLLLSNIIDNGNFNVFLSYVNKSGLTKEHKHVCEELKICLWNANIFNPKILDYLINNYVNVDFKDIKYLIQNEKVDQLEYVIQLIDNRKIQLESSDFAELTELMHNYLPIMGPLWDSLT
jgi:hypothetical protein